MIAGLSVSLVYADSIDFFSDAFRPRGSKLQRQQTNILEKNKIQPSPDTTMEFFYIRF